MSSQTTPATQPPTTTQIASQSPPTSATPQSPTPSLPAEPEPAELTDFERAFTRHARKPRLPLTEPFNPSPELTEALLLDRIDPCLTLGGLTTSGNITFDDLFKWFETPAIAERLERFQQHAIAHVQEHALCAMRQAIPVLTRILQECDYALAKHAIHDQDAKGHELHRRIGETGMHAIAMLHRLATNTASPERTNKLTEKLGRQFAKQKQSLPPNAQMPASSTPDAKQSPPKESYSALLARLFPENVPPPAAQTATSTPNKPLPS